MSFNRFCNARSAEALTSEMDCAEVEMMSRVMFELVLTLTPTRPSPWMSNIVVSHWSSSTSSELKFNFNCEFRQPRPTD